MAWTDEKKADVIKEYTEIMEDQYETDKERADATTEVVKQLSEKYDEKPNGTRMVLMGAGVYIKKTPGTKTTDSASKSGGTKRINKAEAQQSLTNTIAAIDPALVDEEIITKLTGKAAAYFVGVLTTATGE